MNAVMSQWTTFIVCFIFVNAAVLVQSLNRLPTCGYIKVSSSSYHPDFHGIYEMMPSSDGCDGRPAYRLSGSCMYIYYSRSTKEWKIGPTRCGLSAGIAAVSTEIAPDKVISTWEEVSSKADMYGYSIGKEAGNKIWIPTKSLSVSCFDPRQNELTTDTQQTTTPDGNVCSHIRVTNSKHQLNKHGLYEKMSSNYSCDGRPEYIQFGSSNYIYYLGFAWYIGPRSYDNFGGIIATSTARYPNRVTTTWEEFGKEDTPWRKLVNEVDKGSWMSNPSIDVSCYDFAPCGHLRVSKPSYHHDYSGIYEMLSSSDGCYGYPAYKRIGSSKYIYYNSRGIWEFGEKRCGIYVAIQAVSTEVSPDKVTATWEQAVREVLTRRNGVIVEEIDHKWISDLSLSVSCYDPRQKSSSTTKNPGRKEKSSSTTKNPGRKACDQITVTNTINQALDGIYEMLTGYTCNSRPAYKGNDVSHYISYVPGAWIIAPNRCSPENQRIAANSTAMSPDKVTSTWKEHNGTSWVDSPNLQVKCATSQQTSGSFRIYAWLIPVVAVAQFAPTALGV